MAVDNPTIIVPGIKGSSLENFYALSPQSTWSEWDAVSTTLVGPDFASLALDPSARFDASLRVTTRPNGLLPAAYERLVGVLRQKRKLPVYVFPYDWRLSVTSSGAALASFVERVRAKLDAGMPGWSGKLDFVAHSLGGLVFRSFLGQYPQLGDVGQVVFIAVPQRGSLDAVEAMIRGESTLLAGRKEMRKLVRTFPSVYELLPTFQSAVVEQGQALDVFELRTWQDNVTPHGFAGPEVNGFDVQKAHLDAAKAVLSALPSPTSMLAAQDMLTIYGGEPGSTLGQVVVVPQQPFQRWYDFDHAALQQGDGVVPSRSALLSGVPAVKLTRDEISLFAEPSAALLSFHAFIGALDETQSIVSRFLDGDRGAAKLLPFGLPHDRFDAAPQVAP